MEEFFKQGDKEQEQGLDFSPLCDRQNTMVPQSQIGKWDDLLSYLLELTPLNSENMFPDWAFKYIYTELAI